MKICCNRVLSSASMLLMSSPFRLQADEQVPLACQKRHNGNWTPLVGHGLLTKCWLLLFYSTSQLQEDELMKFDFKRQFKDGHDMERNISTAQLHYSFLL